MIQKTQVIGKGSIEKYGKDRETGKDKWRIRVCLGYDPVSKKYIKSPSRTVIGTRAQANQALADYRAEYRAGTIIDAEDISVAEYAQQFHDDRESEFKSPLAWKREKYEIETIKEYFGFYLLQELDTRTIRSTYAKLRKNGFNESKIHRLNQKLSQLMKRAVSDELILRNPCDPISVPRPKAKERKSLSIDVARNLNEILLREEPCAGNCAILLALHTGVRRGEALGLTWEHVHFDKKKVYICQQYARDQVARDPKSKKSIRWLSIDDEVIDYLARWKVKQKLDLENRLAKQIENNSDAITILQTEQSPVVTNEYGGYYNPDVFSRWFRCFCADHGFGKMGETYTYVDPKGIKRTKKRDYTGINFHQLRHTQATLLIGNGADIKTVQNRLGHSSASLTMDIYSHVIEQNDRAAADEICGLLKPVKKEESNSEIAAAS